MSRLAKKIAPQGTPVARRPGARGPLSDCSRLYRDHADLEDWEAVQYLRQTKDPSTGKPLDWRAVQEHVDQLLGITERIPKERFRYHFLRRCDCWPPELKL